MNTPSLVILNRSLGSGLQGSQNTQTTIIKLAGSNDAN